MSNALKTPCPECGEGAKIVPILASELACLQERQRANAALMRDNGKLTEECRDLRERAELGDLARRGTHVLREEVQRQTMLKVGARAEAERLRVKLAEALTARDLSGAGQRTWIAREHRKLREYLQGRGLWRSFGRDRTGGTVNCAVECMEANRNLAADLKRERSRSIGIAANFLTVEAEANALRVRLEAAERAYSDLFNAAKVEIDCMRDALVPLVGLFDFGPDGEPVRSFGDAVAAAVAELRQRRKDADGGLEEDREQWRAACRAAEAKVVILRASATGFEGEATRQRVRADALAEVNRRLGEDLEAERKQRAAAEMVVDQLSTASAAASRQNERLRAQVARLLHSGGECGCGLAALLADPDGQAAEEWHAEAVSVAWSDGEAEGYLSGRLARETETAAIEVLREKMGGDPEETGLSLLERLPGWLELHEADLRLEEREACAKAVEALADHCDRVAGPGYHPPLSMGPAAAYRYAAAEIRRLA